MARAQEGRQWQVDFRPETLFRTFLRSLAPRGVFHSQVVMHFMLGARLGVYNSYNGIILPSSAKGSLRAKSQLSLGF
jgi:hypothetical protein